MQLQRSAIRASLLFLLPGMVAACSGQSSSNPAPISEAGNQLGQSAGRDPQFSPSFADRSLVATLDASTRSSLESAAKTFARTEISRPPAAPQSLTGDAFLDFSRAAGIPLTVAQIDSFIDPAIIGAERQIVLEAMEEMPPDRRHNFEATDGTHDYANTVEGLATLKQDHCQPINEASCLAGNGDVLYYVAPEPDEVAPADSTVAPNATLSGTGFFYKYTENPGKIAFSAARGYVSVPQCSMLVDHKDGITTGSGDTRYYLTGGTSPDSSEVLDTGVQVNSNSHTSAAYFLAFYQPPTPSSSATPPPPIKTSLSASFITPIPCDPGSANVQPQHYILITAGVIASPTTKLKARWQTILEEYDSNGDPVMVTNQEGASVPNTATMPIYMLYSPTWNIECTKCMVKRETTIAQAPTNTDNHTGFEQYRMVMSDYTPPTSQSDVRFPFGELVNWRYGTFANGVSNFPTTQYLGQTLLYYPKASKDDPNGSGELYHWEIMTEPSPPNAGTSGVGIFTATCQTVGTAAPSYNGTPILCATSVNDKIYQGN